MKIQINDSETVSISVHDLECEIYEQGRYLKENFSESDLSEEGTDFVGTDCRLQAVDGGWQLHTGSADYDQDHRGAWGCGSIRRGCTRSEAKELAHKLAAVVKIYVVARGSVDCRVA